MVERVNLLVGAVAFLGATAVVAYIAILRTGDAATTALGALIALTSAGAGFFLRGRVQGPDAPGVLPETQPVRRQGPNEFEPSPDATPEPPLAEPYTPDTGWAGGPGMDTPEPRKPATPQAPPPPKPPA